MASKSIPIGQILVEQGVLSAAQVDQILAQQKRSHRPFGDLAERMFGISPRAVEDAWVEQYVREAGVIDLDDQLIDEDFLRLINRRQAWQFHILPMSRTNDNLNIATSSEHLVRAVNFCSRRIEDPVMFVLAERQQLRDFLMRHYPVPQYLAEYADVVGARN